MRSRLESGAGELWSAAFASPREVFGVCGAACLLRRQLFDDLGGYDESFFSFYEDVDLNLRARIAGWRFAYEPGASAWHFGNASWQAGFDRPGAENARLVARNRIVTQARFVPVVALPRIAAVEAGSLTRAARQRRLRATTGRAASPRRGFAPRLWLPLAIHASSLATQPQSGQSPTARRRSHPRLPALALRPTA